MNEAGALPLAGGRMITREFLSRFTIITLTIRIMMDGLRTRDSLGAKEQRNEGLPTDKPKSANKRKDGADL